MLYARSWLESCQRSENPLALRLNRKHTAIWKILFTYTNADVPDLQCLQEGIDKLRATPRITKGDASPVAKGLVVAANAKELIGSAKLHLNKYRRLSAGCCQRRRRAREPAVRAGNTIVQCTSRGHVLAT